jgi:hypothetical protein
MPDPGGKLQATFRIQDGARQDTFILALFRGQPFS